MNNSMIMERPNRIGSLGNQIFLQEVNSMCVVLELYKLEIISLLPKILTIARKAQSKKKAALIEKTKSQSNIEYILNALVHKTISKVRQEVIQEHGSQINCQSEVEFFSKLDKLMISQDVQVINDEINLAIEKAINGEEPELELKFDDDKLDSDSYKQIVTKIYAVIRFRLYQKIKNKLLKNGSLGESELRECVRDLDIEVVRQDVFHLFQISYGRDTQLSLRKIQYLYQDDEMFQNYLKCLKEAHDRFLGYLFLG